MRSTWPKAPGVTEIFSEYVRQRRDGHSQHEAVDFLKPVLIQLRQDARQQLVALLRSWEAREGLRYPAPGAGDADEFAWLRELEEQEAARSESPAPSGTPASLGATQVFPETPPAPGSNGRSAPRLDVNMPVHPSVQEPQPHVSLPSEETYYCPACGRANRVGAAQCYACGHVVRAAPQRQAAQSPLNPTHFDPSATLVLCVCGHDDPILVSLQARPEILIGRSAAQTALIPDVDLARFGAVDAGVSRQHARLRYQDHAVTITDLGSVNHTYVNEQRLHAHEMRVLQDGDTIRLGRLRLRVHFQPVTGC